MPRLTCPTMSLFIRTRTAGQVSRGTSGGVAATCPVSPFAHAVEPRNLAERSEETAFFPRQTSLFPKGATHARLVDLQTNGGPVGRRRLGHRGVGLRERGQRELQR